MAVPIYIRLQIGGFLTVEAHWGDSLREIKEKIEGEIGIGVWRQTLVFNQRELTNESTFEENGLQKEATLYLVIEAEEKSRSKCAC